MSEPAVEVMDRVAALVAETFDDEGWTVSWKRLLQAHGKGLAADEAIIGIYPESEAPRQGQELLLDVPVVLQVHLGYEDEPDEDISRDPRIPAALVGRLRDAFDPNDAADEDVWYLKFGQVLYPPDPTGNITRFEVRIWGVGDNPSVRG